MGEASDEVIYFYSRTTAYYELSNFSSHGFQLDGAYWPTVEHYFQAQKFPSQPAYQERIRRARSPKDAKALGRSRMIPVWPDWEEGQGPGHSPGVASQIPRPP